MSCLSTALRFGAVKRSGARGDFTWSLGEGTPPIPDDEPDDSPVVQRVVPAAGQPLPVAVLTARATDREPQEKPAGAELTQAVVRAMASSPIDVFDAMQLPNRNGDIVEKAIAEEMRDAFDRSMLAQASADGEKPEVPKEAQAEPQASARPWANGVPMSAALERLATFLQDARLTFDQQAPPRAVPCVDRVRVSFDVTPHQAERICAFVRSMTEVRP
jgi:hypothetical protein